MGRRSEMKWSIQRHLQRKRNQVQVRKSTFHLEQIIDKSCERAASPPLLHAVTKNVASPSQGGSAYLIAAAYPSLAQNVTENCCWQNVSSWNTNCFVV